MQGLKWLRPKQISMKSQLVGFTQLNRANVSETEINDLAGNELADFRRISYGEVLEDRWVLNAASLIAQEEKSHLARVCVTRGYAGVARERGLYVFRFFKDHDPFYVIIDDRIPTIQLQSGQAMPYFARCANPHLFWISLLEKAFAKFHGRYFALDGGSTDEALADMMGVPVENCMIGSAETMSDKGALYNALKALSYNHCILGCKIDYELNLTEAADKERMYARAKSKGLQPHHMYSILDVRTVMVSDPGQRSKPQEVNLVRLQNPWNDAQEWNGKYNDMDNFWSNDNKQKFLDAYEDMRTDDGNSRFIHGWNMDDGIFTMRVEDFLDYFTSIIVCRDWTEHFFGVEYEQPWKLTKSYLSTKSKTILQDRQFIFTQEAKGNPNPIQVTAIMTQEDPRLNQNHGAPYKEHRADIGLLVLDMGKSTIVRDGEMAGAGRAKNTEIAMRSTKPFRQFVVQFAVMPGKYAVIPLVGNQRDTSSGRYSLRLYFNCENDKIKLHSREPVIRVLEYMN